MPNAKKTKLTKKPSKQVKKAPKKAKKAQQPVVAPPVAPTPPPAPPVPPPTPVRTEAQAIWDEIRMRPIEMFGLPAQTVEQHCTFVTVEPSALYVTIRSSATLPSLEAAIAPSFTVELADKFVIVRRVPKPLVPSKRR